MINWPNSSLAIGQTPKYHFERIYFTIWTCSLATAWGLHVFKNEWNCTLQLYNLLSGSLSQSRQSDGNVWLILRSDCLRLVVASPIVRLAQMAKTNKRKNEDQKKKICAKIRNRSKYLVFFRRYNLTSYREKQVIYVAKYRLFYHISRKTEMGMNTKLARPDLALTTRCWI